MFERNHLEEARMLVAPAGAIVLASTALLVGGKTVTASTSASAGETLRPTKGWAYGPATSKPAWIQIVTTGTFVPQFTNRKSRYLLISTYTAS